MINNIKNKYKYKIYYFNKINFKKILNLYIIIIHNKQKKKIKQKIYIIINIDFKKYIITGDY